MPSSAAAVADFTSDNVLVASLASTSQPSAGGRWHHLIWRLLIEDLEDRFELAHCSTELLLLEASREESILDPMVTGGRQFSPSVRRLAVACISQVTIEQELPRATWFQAVAVLDAWLAARSPSAFDTSFLREMIAACTVVLRLVFKTSVDAAHNRFPGWVEIVSQVMQRFGYDLPSAPLHELHIMEQSLLLDLQWQVNAPTLESWISILGARFGVTTEELYAKPLAWATEKMRQLAKRLVEWKAADWQRRPQRLAAGLFGIGLASEGLLHIEDLRPQYVYTQEWEELFLGTQTRTVLPRCRLSPRYAQHVLTSFIGAANLPMEELQQDCEFTMRCLQDAAGALRPMQRLAFAL